MDAQPLFSLWRWIFGHNFFSRWPATQTQRNATASADTTAHSTPAMSTVMASLFVLHASITAELQGSNSPLHARRRNGSTSHSTFSPWPLEPILNHSLLAALWSRGRMHGTGHKLLVERVSFWRGRDTMGRLAVGFLWATRRAQPEHLRSTFRFFSALQR